MGRGILNLDVTGDGFGLFQLGLGTGELSADISVVELNQQLTFVNLLPLVDEARCGRCLEKEAWTSKFCTGSTLPLVLMVLLMSWRDGAVLVTRIRRGRNIWKRPAETASQKHEASDNCPSLPSLSRLPVHFCHLPCKRPIDLARMHESVLKTIGIPGRPMNSGKPQPYSSSAPKYPEFILYSMQVGFPE